MKKDPQLELELICYDKDGKVIEPPKEKGPHDDFIEQIERDISSETTTKGRGKTRQELYPNAPLTLVPEENTTVAPVTPPEEPKEQVEKKVEDEEPPGYRYPWQEWANR
jgi:hypothetical protein